MGLFAKSISDVSQIHIASHFEVCTKRKGEGSRAKYEYDFEFLKSSIP